MLLTLTPPTLASLANLSLLAQPSIVNVSKGGSDTAGSGSALKPYGTIQKAFNVITDASSSKPYAVAVGAGIFAEAFALKPWIFLIGNGRNVTTLGNPAANWISADFAGAGVLETGIVNCGLSATCSVNFNAVGSPGAGRIYLQNLLTHGTAINVTGNNTSNLCVVESVFMTDDGFPVNTFTSISALLTNVRLSLTLAFVHTQPYFVYATCYGLNSVFITMNCPNVVQANNLSVTFLDGPVHTTPTINSGDGVIFTARNAGKVFITAPDANATFCTTSVLAGAVRMVNSGVNFILTVPTAPRTYTFSDTPTSGTEFTMVNGGAATITFAGNVAGTLIANQTKTFAFFSGAWRLTAVN